MAAVSGLQIAIVLQDLKHVGDSPGSIINLKRGTQPYKTAPSCWREDPLSGCLSKDFHRYRVAVCVSQSFLETS